MTEVEKTELERRVRLYYDRRLGGFMNVGFRGCEGEEEPELVRCLLVRKDYDVLVLPYEHPAGHFGAGPIEGFAARMPCPTVLVGPNGSDQLHLNTPAKLWMKTMGLNQEELFAVGRGGNWVCAKNTGNRKVVQDAKVADVWHARPA